MSGHQNRMEGGLLKTQMAVSDPAGMGWGLRMCISNKLPDEADTAGWLARPWRSKGRALHFTKRLSTWLHVASPWELSKIQMLRPSPGLTESNLWEWNLGFGSLKKFLM